MIDDHQTVDKEMVDGHLTVDREMVDGHQTVDREMVDGRQSVNREMVDGHQTVDRDPHRNVYTMYCYQYFIMNCFEIQKYVTKNVPLILNLCEKGNRATGFIQNTDPP